MLSDFLKSAILLHQAGHVAEAEEQYRQITAKEPDNADAWHLLGILLGQQKRCKEALGPLKHALKLQPACSSFHDSLGNVYKHLGDFEQALFHYTEALKSPSASSSVHNNLGTLYHLRKQWGQAIIHYQNAIKIRPDYADCHYNKGTALIELACYKQAIKAFRKTLQYEPDHPQAHFHLAQLLLWQNKSKDAISHCAVFAKTHPDHTEAHHQMAVALTQEDRIDEAISHYQKTLALKPDHDEALHNLGALYVVAKKPDLALSCYLKLLAIAPSFDAYYNIGVIYLYQDKQGDAINYLKAALKIEHKAFNAYVNLGAAYLKCEDLQEAKKYYEKALAMKPDDLELQYILAAISEKDTYTCAPASYITNLFNQYAPYFEKHLQQCLDYRVPTLLQATFEKLTDTQRQVETLLDLGCGTGLCGQMFRSHTKNLIGIDLSDKMLEVARKKNVYDTLENMDIQDALIKYQDIDLLIAGDVFGYIGDLGDVFSHAAQALRIGRYFIFTTEQTGKQDFILQNNARFAHHSTYIKKLAISCHFDVVLQENAVLRQQRGKPVEGVVWVMRCFA